MPKTIGDAAATTTAAPDLLRNRAYQEIKSLILNGQLGRTPFLSERQLARQLGMSNTPVRSAVERLELEGLLTIGARRGLVVEELTDREIVDHFEIRRALESLVVGKLAGRLGPERAAALRANVDAYEAALEAGDMPAFIALDGEFHLRLAEFCGNADVGRVLRQLRDRIFRVVVRVIRHTPERPRASVREHRAIIDRIEAGDADAAVAAMTGHLRAGLEALVPGGAAAAPDSISNPSRTTDP